MGTRKIISHIILLVFLILFSKTTVAIHELDSLYESHLKSAFYNKDVTIFNQRDSLLKVAYASKEDQLISKAYFIKGAYALYYQKRDSLLYFMRKSHQYAEKANDSLSINGSNLFSAVEFSLQGRLDSSAYFYHKLYMHSNDYKSELNALAGISSIFRQLDNRKQAIYYSKAALQLMKDNKKTESIHFFWSDIANLYLEINQLDSAWHYLGKIDRHIGHNPDNDRANYYFDILGNYYLQKKNYDEALHYCKISLKANMISQGERVGPLLIICKIYWEKKDHVNFLKYLTLTTEAMKEFPVRWLEKELYILKKKFHESRGEYKLAFQWMEKVQEIELEFYKYRNSRIISMIQLVDVLKSKEDQINQQQANLSSLNIANETLQWKKVALGLACMLLILIILGVVYQSRQNKKKASTTIVSQQKELTDLALFLSQNQDVMEKLQVQLRKVKHKVDGSEKSQLIEMETSLKTQVKNQGNTRKIQHSLDQNIASFESSLLASYPNLTSKEKQLISLLRINLTSKEIAAILNITSASVDVSRSRLRKKLNIDKNISLTEFFSEIA